MVRFAGDREEPRFTLPGTGIERDRFGEPTIEATERIGEDPEMLHDSDR